LKTAGEFFDNIAPRVFLGFTEVSDAVTELGSNSVSLNLGIGNISQIPAGTYPLTVCQITCSTVMVKHRGGVGGKG
jgi:hypothetical protein